MKTTTKNMLRAILEQEGPTVAPFGSFNNHVGAPISMLGVWLARAVEPLPGGRFVAGLLIYICGYGSLLCAITVDSYIKEWRGAAATWDKTEKVGRVVS